MLLSCWHNIFFPEVGLSYLGEEEENNVFVLFFNQYIFFGGAHFKGDIWEEFSILSPSLFLERDCGSMWPLYPL